MDWESLKIPVGDWAEAVVDWLTAHGAWFFDGLSGIVTAIIDGILWVLQTPPALVIVAVFALLAWLLQRSLWTVALVLVGFAYILNQGYWEETTETLTLVLSSVIVCVSPAMICGSAYGSSTLRSSCPGVAPKARPASFSSFGVVTMPRWVSRIGAGSTKIAVATSPGTMPMPKKMIAGIR